MDKISIVMPLYNAEKFIEKTLNTVLNQTYENWELIIVNDCSKDSSPQIVNKLSDSDSRVKLFNQEQNGGSAKARNRGLKEASGRYIVFLDSDDLWNKSFLEDQLKFLTEKQAALVFASYKMINENDEDILRPFIVPSSIGYKDLLKRCTITCLTAMYDTRKVDKIYFDESLGSLRDDYVMWLTMLKKINVAYGNENLLASYRVFSNSTTGSKRKMIKPHFNVYYKIEKLGIAKSLWYMIYWAWFGFKKYKS